MPLVGAFGMSFDPADGKGYGPPSSERPGNMFAKGRRFFLTLQNQTVSGPDEGPSHPAMAPYDGFAVRVESVVMRGSGVPTGQALFRLS